jgi:chromosome segregation ATPase
MTITLEQQAVDEVTQLKTAIREISQEAAKAGDKLQKLKDLEYQYQKVVTQKNKLKVKIGMLIQEAKDQCKEAKEAKSEASRLREEIRTYRAFSDHWKVRCKALKNANANLVLRAEQKDLEIDELKKIINQLGLELQKLNQEKIDQGR